MRHEADLVLYDYWRSSAAYRVRIALHLKGLAFEQRPVHLVRNGGEQHQPAYRAVNPQGLVPALLHQGHVITQSLAICDYLEEVFPASPLLPKNPVHRARVRSLALTVACDIHPLNNLRVQQLLKRQYGVEDEGMAAWMRHWMGIGFDAMEHWLTDCAESGDYCHGDEPGLADCCLVPQVYNAERFDCDLSPFPRIRQIAERCRALPAFAAAAPERQPDAPAT